MPASTARVFRIISSSLFLPSRDDVLMLSLQALIRISSSGIGHAAESKQLQEESEQILPGSADH